jgi:ubiquinone/menaquinone biosynthesis C-methylase UbiE
MKINIGCGRDYREGWLNTDVSYHTKADAHFDIGTDVISRSDRLGADIKDGEADLIYISGVLEQIGENKQLIHAMNECHRVLKPGGIMEVVVPNARYAIAHQDPMDIRKFTPETFNYFLKGTRQFDLYGSVYGFEGWSKIDIQENERHILVIKMTK